MDDSFSPRPVAGRLIALDLRPTRPLTFLGPAWAAFCGAVASGALLSRQSLLVLILALLLCDVLLGAWRALWLHADWRTAIQRNAAGARVWLSFSDDETGSPLARRWRRLARRADYVRRILWPLIDSDIIAMLMAGLLALTIALVLGPAPVVLVALAMTLGLVEGETRAEIGTGLRALVEVAIPWLIAQTALGSFHWLALVFALLFTLVYRALVAIAEREPGRWIALSNLAQLGVVLLLIFSNMPIGAAVVTLGLLAQVLWQIRHRLDRDGRAYAQRVQSYLLVAMLIAGISLWL